MSPIMSPPPGYSKRMQLGIGEDVQVDRQLVKVPPGQSIVKAYWTTKDDLTEADSAAVWQKIITPVDQPGVGQIIDTGATSGIAVFRWDAPAGDTARLVAGPLYVYDMVLISSAGKNHTQERGVIIGIPRVTQATT